METKPLDGEILAAITMALYEYQGGTTHDLESGRLTQHAEKTDWNCKFFMQRQLPVKK